MVSLRSGHPICAASRFSEVTQCRHSACLSLNLSAGGCRGVLSMILHTSDVVLFCFLLLFICLFVKMHCVWHLLMLEKWEGHYTLTQHWPYYLSQNRHVLITGLNWSKEIYKKPTLVLCSIEYRVCCIVCCGQSPSVYLTSKKITEFWRVLQIRLPVIEEDVLSFILQIVC